jgi:hypothetical protein
MACHTNNLIVVSVKIEGKGWKSTEVAYIQQKWKKTVDKWVWPASWGWSRCNYRTGTGISIGRFCFNVSLYSLNVVCCDDTWSYSDLNFEEWQNSGITFIRNVECVAWYFLLYEMKHCKQLLTRESGLEDISYGYPGMLPRTSASPPIRLVPPV